MSVPKKKKPLTSRQQVLATMTAILYDASNPSGVKVARELALLNAKEILALVEQKEADV